MPLTQAQRPPDLTGIGDGQFHNVAPAGKRHPSIVDRLKGGKVASGGLKVKGHDGFSGVVERETLADLPEFYHGSGGLAHLLLAQFFKQAPGAAVDPQSRLSIEFGTRSVAALLPDPVPTDRRIAQGAANPHRIGGVDGEGDGLWIGHEVWCD